MPNYVVQPGDSLSKMAKAHGLKDWHAIVDHPQNKERFAGRSSVLRAVAQSLTNSAIQVSW